MKTLKRLACALIPLLALAACGDDSSTGSGGSGSGTGGGGSTTSGTGGDGSVTSGTGGTGTGGAAAEVDLPSVDGVTFVEGVDNPYFPLPVGATWTLEAETEEGLERIEVSVESETRTIQGVVATIVKDTVYLDDVIIEDTFDWFAQDAEGNVWYLGEDTCEFVDGVCDGLHEGAWEWGVEGALPGIIMPASPTVDGQPYYQEYDEGEAEDAGEVIETGVSITVPAGSFTDCITTRDFSTLDPELEEEKTYCPGVGNVHVSEPDAVVELIATTGLD